MAVEAASGQTTDGQGKEAPAKWWCNFCGFATDDEREYLQHSCVDVLAAKGQTVASTGQNECR